MNYWLMKSEPECFGIHHLAARPEQTEHWDGVRNYQVRNMMRDQMRRGDQAFFYHSSCAVPGIVGTMEIVREAYPDFTAFAQDSEHYDPRSNPAKPSWLMVDVRHLCTFERIISLEELKNHSLLQTMALLRRGNRLSIMPVSATEWRFILSLI